MKGMGEDAIQHCRSYALEAERRMGEMLADTERAQGKRTDLVTRGDQVETPPTLADLGLTKNESAKAQALAALPRATFEAVKSGEKSGAPWHRARHPDALAGIGRAGEG